MCWQIVLELHSKGLIKVQEKKEKVVDFCSRPQQNVKFHVVVVQRRQRNVRKGVMHVQSCCFARYV